MIKTDDILYKNADGVGWGGGGVGGYIIEHQGKPETAIRVRFSATKIYLNLSKMQNT